MVLTPAPQIPGTSGVLAISVSIMAMFNIKNIKFVQVVPTWVDYITREYSWQVDAKRINTDLNNVFRIKPI